MPTINELIYLAFIYFIAYWLGVLVSKFWFWLRCLVLLMVPGSFFYNLNFSAINLPNFLVLILPACIFAYPSVIRIFAPERGLANPIRWIYETINEKRYLKRREKEREQERESQRETLERAERIIRMQAEEAERQRQFEREKAERETRERTEREQQGQGASQQTKDNTKQEQTSKQGNRKDWYDSRGKIKLEIAYKILDLSPDATFEQVKARHKKLQMVYHPDANVGFSEHDRKEAEEKTKDINEAFDKIKEAK
jgi:hypothetical protein